MHQYYRELLDEVGRNKAIRESGKQVCIPYPFPRLRSVLPGIEKGQHICLTAGTGAGKSKTSRFLYIYSVVEYIKANPDCGIKPKIFYFILENSRKEVVAQMAAHHIKKEYKMDTNSKVLMSKDEIVSDEIHELLIKSEGHFDDLFKYVTIIHNIHSPLGIYKVVSDYMKTAGTIHYEKKLKNGGADGEMIDIPVSYTPNDPEEHVIVIVDNVNNLQPEKSHSSKRECIKDWTANYARMRLCKFYDCTVLSVQQQDMESQKLSYTSFDATPVKGKVVPSLASLAENKTTSQDYHVILGIFHPRHYKFTEDLGYKLDILEDNYRNLMVLKSNDTSSGWEVGIYFNGASEVFMELPLPGRELNDFYDNYKKKFNK